MMKWITWRSAALMAALLLGCEVRDDSRQSPFDQEVCDYVLLIALDADDMKDHPQVYDFITRSIDRYFEDRIGGEDHLILSQLSGNQRPLLWQGTPQQLRRDFPDRGSFHKFLHSHCDKGSRINAGVAESLDYVLSTFSVSEGKAKTAAMIVSDMIDDQPEADESRLMEALIRFGHRGDIAFYFVDQVRMAHIRRVMTEAGFKMCKIECDIHGRPPLPHFE